MRKTITRPSLRKKKLISFKVSQNPQNLLPPTTNVNTAPTLSHVQMILKLIQQKPIQPNVISADKKSPQKLNQKPITKSTTLPSTRKKKLFSFKVSQNPQNLLPPTTNVNTAPPLSHVQMILKLIYQKPIQSNVISADKKSPQKLNQKPITKSTTLPSTRNLKLANPPNVLSSNMI